MTTFDNNALFLRNEEEQRVIAEQHTVLRRGTAAERRRLLKLRLLPLPDDIDAVAVPAVAVLDLPTDGSVTTAAPVAHSRGRRRSDLFDPLQQLADRYGGSDSSGSEDEEGEEEAGNGATGVRGVDFAAFIEVLCPNGTSLLERLPLPVPRSQTRCRQRSRLSCVKGASSAGPQPLSPSPFPQGSSGGTPSRSPERPQPPLCQPQAAPQAEYAVGTYVDAPIFLTEGPAGTLDDTIASPAPQQQQHQQEEGGDLVDLPQIFISVGADSLPLPRSSRRRHSKPAKLSSHGSNTSLLSADPPSPASGSSQSTPCRDGPHVFTPLTETSTCDLGGRVLLTDRLIASQTTTALPTMLEAYQQYREAATLPSQPPSRQSLHESGHVHLSSKEQEAAMRSQLAPRQRGIVLRLNNTTPEVLNCVKLARRCVRPTFRYIDPVELYGTSSYTSGPVSKHE